MSKIQKFLNENKMGKMIARLLGKEDLAIDTAGKPVLSADEKTKILSMYGEAFLEKFEGMDFSAEDAEQTHQLFDAALAHARQTVEAQKDAIINQLRSDLVALASAPESAPAATAVGAVPSPSAFKANMALGHNKAAQSFLRSGVLAESTTIDVADLKQELGAYSSQGNNIDMVNELYQSFSTGKKLAWKPAVTEYKAVSAQSVGSVVQQFKKEWSPKGGGKFTLLTVKNYRHKVDFAIDPADVGESWLFHLYDERKSPDQMPITRYIVSNILIPQIAEDLELVMTGKAKYVEGSEETSATMNGIETQLVEALASEDKKGMSFYKDAKNLLNGEDEEVLDAIDDFVASVAPLYRSKQMPVYLSSDLYLKYKRAYKKKWGAGSGTENPKFGTDRVDFSNFYLEVLDCLTGSPIFFSTPHGNLVGLKHKNPPQFISDIQKHDREVRFYLEFWYGVGFLIGEAVFAYVPAGYTPSVVSTRQGAAGKWITSTAAAASVEEGPEGA